jgi:hypothetical protein
MILTTRRHILLFLFGTFIFLFFCENNYCFSQTPFIVGTPVKWGNKGRPYTYNGAKFSIFDVTCMNAKLSGINISLICSKIRAVYGFSFAGYALYDEATGFQFAFINKTTTVKGFQIGLMNQRAHFVESNRKAGNYGLQLGLTNSAYNNFGVQIGLYNSSSSGSKGISAGGININSFFQFGLINIKKDINKGIQIGIINYRKGNKWFAKVLPIVNFKIENKEGMNDW